MVGNGTDDMDIVPRLCQGTGEGFGAKPTRRDFGREMLRQQKDAQRTLLR